MSEAYIIAPLVERDRQPNARPAAIETDFFERWDPPTAQQWRRAFRTLAAEILAHIVGYPGRSALGSVARPLRRAQSRREAADERDMLESAAAARLGRVPPHASGDHSSHLRAFH